MIWFSSDWHLGHKNIIKYDNRPFKTVKEMDDTIIKNVNSVVRSNDTLYYLGDFTLYGHIEDVIDYRDRINCRHIYLIFGNHDKVLKKNQEYLRKERIFLETWELKEIKVDIGGPESKTIALCHYAMKVWNKSHHGAWHLYGHSHHNLPEDPHSLSFDVGINGWDYMPVSLDQVKEKMREKVWKPIDHHQGDLEDK